MTKLSGPMLAPANGAPPRHIMVLLHGYGADGSDLIDLGRHWGRILPDTLFVAPNAPHPCAQNPFGFEWFALEVDRIRGRIEGAREAAPVLREFLADLWRQSGLGPAETWLVGFSQGAMMALHVGTGLEAPLAGIVAFSGAFVPSEAYASGAAAKPPVALIHGALDQVVEPALSREAAEVLGAAGLDVALHFSPGMAHGIAEDGLEFATAFLLATKA